MQQAGEVGQVGVYAVHVAEVRVPRQAGGGLIKGIVTIEFLWDYRFMDEFIFTK